MRRFSAIALPNFRVYLANSRLTNTANSVLIAFNIGRSYAVSNNANVRVDPAYCGATEGWAYGGFAWVDNGGAVPTASTDTRVVGGGPVVAVGADCSNLVTSKLAGGQTAALIRYISSGRAQMTTTGLTGWTNSPVAGGVVSDYTVGFCDSNNLVPQGPVVHVDLSGRASVQAKGTTCP